MKNKGYFGRYIQMIEDGLIEPTAIGDVKTEPVSCHRYWFMAYNELLQEDYELLKDSYNEGKEISKKLCSEYIVKADEYFLTVNRMKANNTLSLKVLDTFRNEMDFITDIAGSDAIPSYAFELVDQTENCIKDFQDYISKIKTSKQAKSLYPKYREMQADMTKMYNENVALASNRLVWGAEYMLYTKENPKSKVVYIEVDSDETDGNSHKELACKLTENRLTDYIPENTYFIISSKTSDVLYGIGNILNPSDNKFYMQGFVFNGNIFENHIFYIWDTEYNLGDKKVKGLSTGNTHGSGFDTYANFSLRGRLDKLFLTVCNRVLPLLKGEKTDKARFLDFNEMMDAYCEDRDLITVNKTVREIKRDKDMER